MSGIADLTDSLLGWASQTELTLNQRFADVPLFVQAGLAGDELERIDRFYGTFLSRQLAAGADLEALVRDTPALAVTTLVARAARMIDPSNFYAEYAEGLELRATPEWIATFERITVELLQTLGLAAPACDDPVVALTLHAGVTGSEVAGILELLDRLDPEISAVQVVDLLAQGGYQEFQFCDEETGLPVFSLAATVACAQCAPELFTPIIQQIIDIRQQTIEDPVYWQDSVRPALPDLVWEAVAAELRERPAGTVNRAEAVGVATREAQPRLVLDIARNKICLRLPEQLLGPDNTEVQWRVTLDGTTRIYRTGSSWGDVYPFTEVLDLTIDHQVRELTVSDVTNGMTWALPVVDSNDPVLVFSPKGANLTAKASLHYSELFVVCPEDATLVDVVTGAEVPVIETFEINGWTSWSCRRVDAQHVASLQVVRPEQSPSAMQQVRCVDPRKRVMFRDPEPPIPHVFSHGGLPVHARSLVAEFPPTLSGRPETWFLSISSYAGPGNAGEEVAPAEPLEIPAEGGIFDIFDPEIYDAPWVGEYLIRLRGPRNESFRHEYAIVEGILASTEFSGLCRSFRIPAQGGLSEAALLVKPSEKPFNITPAEVHVAPAAPSADFVIATDEGDQMPLRFIPPRLHFEVPLTTMPPMWRTTRLVVSPRQCDASGTLRIRATGELDDPKITVRNHHGAPLRTVKLSRIDARTYSTPMAQLAASTQVMTNGRIEFEWTDKRSDKRVSVNLAVIESAPHAAGCAIEDNHLVFTDLVGDRQLAAWVWPATAPWASARTLQVAHRTELPVALRQAGPLKVQLHSADPLSVLRAPMAPGSDAFTVEQEGYYQQQPAALVQLSAFLAGAVEQAPNDPSVMPVLWDYLDGWGDSGVDKAVMAALSANSNAALKGLSASLVPAEKQPGRVIASGLVHGAFSGCESVTEVHRTAWIGTLELLAQLPARFSEVERGEPRARLREVLQNLEEVAGKRMVEALATGRDATLDTACIDKSTVQIAQMNEAQQQALLAMFFSQAEIVPGPIMEDSARLLAVFETFKKRNELTVLLSDQGLIKPAVSLLRALRGANRQIYSSARIRFDKLDGVDTNDRANTWALAPVVSLVFALSARMHAHGLMGKSKLLLEAAQGWSQLADIVPDLVTGDIIAAEAMVLAVKYPGIAD
ncbi:hypothetical protein [Corynebacterium freiburgense]|uniref:hypothetical protein n=1 Tax=Corynebacterium freiburgense TaxID=556548 RepID=UPI00040EFC20|nr:hypothetical protein [Corynebacterium freiburgense]WJZ03051.1 hypothetical protein CFREI_08865 [Corynebacterium freiburgense]